MTLQEMNAKRWADCHVSSAKGPVFQSVANRLTAPAAKARYQAVEKRTGVPWWFIAVAHEREASQNWNTQLGQGDPLNKKSVHVPKGRGPFSSWEDGAVDALVNCAPFASKNKDWSPGGALTMLEKYNGLGYYKRNLPSPYIWAGTDQYTRGKFVSDGKFSADTVDSQLGCAGLLKFMGVFQKTSVPTPTGTALAGGTLLGSVTLYKYWHIFEAHWILYSLGLITAAVIIDVLIHVYKNKDKNVTVS